jgi:TatD DNase family protein
MLCTSPFVDFHTHCLKSENDVIEVLSCHSACPDKTHYHTLGYHPWWQVSELTISDLEHLRLHYNSHLSCLGIGECGLDKFRGAPAHTQIKIFRQQLDLASELGAPVIIHCVKSHQEIVSFKKEYPDALWCIHGFNKNTRLAAMLLDHGIYLSISPDDTWLKSRNELLSFLPVNQIFIESDGRSDISIQGRYTVLSQSRNLTVDEVRTSLFHNFKSFFKAKWKHLNG